MLEFSQSAKHMRTSEIRDLMELATRPDIISFAGGMPNNNLFPIKQLDDIYAHLSEESKKAGFQYGPTGGYPPLLESLKEYLRDKGLPVDSNELIITTGSLQAINLVAKVFLDPDDQIITETPCFIGATSAFYSYQAQIVGIPVDEDGIIISELKKALTGRARNAKILYITPYFHNPAGIIYSKKRKEELLALLQEHKILLMEDDAYGELYFDKKDKELTIPLKVLAKEQVPICYTGSFSKIFGPGMRLGWLLASPDIIEKCSLAKQSIDACSSTFTQMLANEFLVQKKLPGYLQSLRKAYSQRRDIMLQSLKEYMPAEIKWTEPRGGFYIWLTLPEYMDATEILKSSIEKGAVFVIGKTFDPEGVRNNCLRLAFSHTPEDKIYKGVKIIAEAVREFTKN